MFPVGAVQIKARTAPTGNIPQQGAVILGARMHDCAFDHVQVGSPTKVPEPSMIVRAFRLCLHGNSRVIFLYAAEPQFNRSILLLRRKLAMRLSILLGSALLIAGLTAACQPVQPEALSVQMGTVPTSPDTATQPTVFVLPDGTVCTFAGTGATLAFDGERLNYTCEAADAAATAADASMLGLLGDPVQDPMSGAGAWTATLATYSHGDDGFSLDATESVTFFGAELDLADGSVCLHAGFGATLGFEDKRLNYTCGQTDTGDTGIIGELQYDAAAMPGVYVAQKVIFHSAGDAGFVMDASELLDVTRIVGNEMPQ
jgi:hypothetical protein